jgi:hypothetical protein
LTDKFVYFFSTKIFLYSLKFQFLKDLRCSSLFLNIIISISKKFELQAQPPETGWVPGSYFETPSNYYKQKRHTRELDETSAEKLTEEQKAILKRE